MAHPAAPVEAVLPSDGRVLTKTMHVFASTAQVRKRSPAKPMTPQKRVLRRRQNQSVDGADVVDLIAGSSRAHPIDCHKKRDDCC